MAAMRRAWRWGAVKGYLLPPAPWLAEIMLTEAPAKEVLATQSEVASMFAACDQQSASLGASFVFWWQPVRGSPMHSPCAGAT